MRRSGIGRPAGPKGSEFCRAPGVATNAQVFPKPRHRRHLCSGSAGGGRRFGVAERPAHPGPATADLEMSPVPPRMGKICLSPPPPARSRNRAPPPRSDDRQVQSCNVVGRIAFRSGGSMAGFQLPSFTATRHCPSEGRKSSIIRGTLPPENLVCHRPGGGTSCDDLESCPVDHPRSLLDAWALRGAKNRNIVPPFDDDTMPAAWARPAS